MEPPLAGNVGEGMHTADPVDEGKADSTPVQEEGTNKEQEHKDPATGQDDGQPASRSKEASTSEVVVTTIH